MRSPSATVDGSDESRSGAGQGGMTEQLSALLRVRRTGRGHHRVDHMRIVCKRKLLRRLLARASRRLVTRCSSRRRHGPD